MNKLWYMGLGTGIIISVLLSSSIRIAAAETAKDMALIPAGEFIMGSEEGDQDEAPEQKIYLDAFYIDKYEVTNAQYRQFVKTTSHREPYDWKNNSFNQHNQPVVGVSWEDAAAYCEWVGRRLPTEAEWEKAARGQEGWGFPWGNKWNIQNANSSAADKHETAPVGSYPQGVSPYGVYDMAGNIWEWCADWYGADYYHLIPKRNPTGSVSGDAKVIRGGGWFDSPTQLRSSNRFYSHPMVRYNGIGFRCAKDYK